MTKTITPETIAGDWTNPTIGDSSASNSSSYGLLIKLEFDQGGNPELVFDAYYDPGCSESFDEPFDHNYHRLSWSRFLTILSGLVPGQKASLSFGTMEILADGENIQLTVAPYSRTFSRRVL